MIFDRMYYTWSGVLIQVGQQKLDRMDTTSTHGNGVRVAIVEDHPLMRLGLQTTLSSWSRCAGMFMAENGEEYEQYIRKGERADLVLVDLLMPVRDGFETLQWIKRKQPEVIAVAISYDPNEMATERAVRAGARAVLPKSLRSKELLEALEEVLDKGFHSATMGSIAASWRSSEHQALPRAQAEVIKKFTTRELEFLQHVCAADDHGYQEIARRMDIGQATVETYRRSVFQKLGVSSRQALYRAALRWGLAGN